MNQSDDVSMGAGTRGSSVVTNIEDRGCHRNQVTGESAGRPLAILPMNKLQRELLSHLNSPSREIGTTTPLVGSLPTSHTRCSSLSNIVPTASTSGLTVAPRSSPDASTVDLASLFECPVCMDYALPPILQCQSGHIVCAPCRSKLSSCPTCRGNLDNIRNLAMEKLASSVLFPCKYSTSGCPESFHYAAKGDHEALCEYRPYDCPCPGASCKWLGELEQVMPHLMHHHKSITTLQGNQFAHLSVICLYSSNIYISKFRFRYLRLTMQLPLFVYFLLIYGRFTR